MCCVDEQAAEFAFVEDEIDISRGKSNRRLVKQKQLRIAHERAPNGKHLLLPAAQRPRSLLEAFAEHREAIEDPVARFAVFRRPPATPPRTRDSQRH
jgi:hypothetical protein